MDRHKIDSPNWPTRITQVRLQKRSVETVFHEYRTLPTAAPSTLVIFGIKAAGHPADYFTVYYRDGSEEEKRIKRANPKKTTAITRSCVLRWRCYAKRQVERSA